MKRLALIAALTSALLIGHAYAGEELITVRGFTTGNTLLLLCTRVEVIATVT